MKERPLRRGEAAGLTEDVADRISDDYETSDLDDRQKAALRWTDAVSNQPTTVPPVVREQLEHFLNRSQIVELTLALALFHGLSRALGDETETSMLAMSSRYMGPAGGKRYTDAFMRKLATNDFPDGHGDSEVVVTITPEHWRTEILP